MTNRTPAAPAGLGPRAKKLWTDLHQTWQFAPDEHEILRLACEAVERAVRAQAEIDARGLVIDDRYGTKANPALRAREAAEASAARLLKQLGFSREAERALKNARIEHGVIQAHKRQRGA